MRTSCKSISKILFLSALAATAAPAAAQQVSAGTVRRVLTRLAADDMAGRPTDGPGNLKAAEFLAAEFKRIGLQPLPGQSSFMQEFPAYETTTTDAQVTLDGQALPAGQVLALTTQPQLNWTERDSVRVLLIGPTAKLQDHYQEIFQPAKNTLVLLDPIQTEWFKQLAGRLAGPQLHKQAPAAPAPACVLVLTAASAAPATYRVTATTTQQTRMLRNVVGYLPGRSAARAHQEVVFSGHYDHLGILKPVAGDSIANGADDDASGTTAVVALAEYFKQRRDNARPLIFAAFTGEEIGGYGSTYFSKQLDPKHIVAMFNIEMIGKPAKFGPNTAFITGYEKSDFGKLLQANLQGTKFKFEPDPYPEQNLFYRSDNATLASLGVPAHTISTDQIPTDKLYHSVDDEVGSLDLANMTAVIQAIARSARGIVAGQQTPTRVAPEK